MLLSHRARSEQIRLRVKVDAEDVVCVSLQTLETFCLGGLTTKRQATISCGNGGIQESRIKKWQSVVGEGKGKMMTSAIKIVYVCECTHTPFACEANKHAVTHTHLFKTKMQQNQTQHTHTHTQTQRDRETHTRTIHLYTPPERSKCELWRRLMLTQDTASLRTM